MDQLIDNIFNELLLRGVDARIIVVIIAILPIAEARLAIPIALKCGLTPFEAFFYGFVGSSLCVPVLLTALIPLIKFLARTRLFAKLGASILGRFEGKAESISKGSTLKSMLGTAAFVAVPLPLTGVWTGSAVASILGIGYFKALLAVVAGNFVASALVLFITLAFSEYINIIMTVFAAIAILTALSLLIKTLGKKRMS